MPETQDVPGDLQLAYAQAVKYGKDLARIYGQEKAKRQELQIANQKLNAILQTAPNGLAVLDEEMRVIEANPRFEALLEQRGRCMGRCIAELIPEKRLVSALEATTEDSPLDGTEISIAEPARRTLQVTGARLSAGTQKGWVVSIHDLTERKRLEGLKEEFIDIAAHELRTPLAIILGFASVLDEDTDESTDPAMAAPIDAIVRAANRLKMVINELVEFASARNRPEANDSQPDEFDLQEVLDHVITSQSYQAGQQGIEVRTTQPGYGLKLKGDRIIIAQAIEHVLENAIRFNRPEGRVELRVRQAQDQVVVEIEDTGSGIPSTDLEKIFDMFYQVEEHMTRAQGGLGLGLSIAKRGIELHGGRMTVRSKLGEGSCFSIILPRASDQVFISPRDRLDSAHQQTLAYGRDMARAFVAQRNLTRRLQRVAQLGREMLDCLPPDPARTEVDRIRSLCRRIVDEVQVKRSPDAGERQDEDEWRPD